LKALAAAGGLDTAKFNACFDARRYADTVKQDQALAGSLGINATPTLLVNGAPVASPNDATQVQQALDAAIAKAGQ
jgi:protein-disulfide isomerase